MKKISIIIPVYNVEPYIGKSLDSVINQTYRHLEIICVNDGSTDCSGEICEKYAASDSRIVVIHKKNGGYSSAINTGLDAASGEFIGFVDPDDWVELDYYESVYGIMDLHKVDFVCTGRFKDTEKESFAIRNSNSFESGKVDSDTALLYTFIRDQYPAFGAYCWNKLFRATPFKAGDNGSPPIRMIESLRVASDVVMFVEYALRSRCAYYFDNPYYHYFQRENSLVHSQQIEKRIDVLTAYDRVIELLEKSLVDREILVWVKRFYVYHASVLADMALKNGDAAYLSIMQRKMNRYLSEYLDTNRNHPDRIERIQDLVKIQI